MNMEKYMDITTLITYNVRVQTHGKNARSVFISAQ